MGIENDDILERKRHKELLSAIQLLSQEFKASIPAVDTSIADKIGEHIRTVERLIEKIKPQELPTPNVNVVTNQERVIESIREMKNEIVNSLSALKVSIDNMPRDWTCDVSKRDHGGFLKTLNLKAV